MGSLTQWIGVRLRKDVADFYKDVAKEAGLDTADVLRFALEKFKVDCQTGEFREVNPKQVAEILRKANVGIARGRPKDTDSE